MFKVVGILLRTKIIKKYPNSAIEIPHRTSYKFSFSFMLVFLPTFLNFTYLSRLIPIANRPINARSATHPIGFHIAALLEKLLPCDIPININDKNVIPGKLIAIPANLADLVSAIVVIIAIKKLPDMK